MSPQYDRINNVVLPALLIVVNNIEQYCSGSKQYFNRLMIFCHVDCKVKIHLNVAHQTSKKIEVQNLVFYMV